MYSMNLPLNVKGHVKIEDDLGNVLVDQDNAVHPQNMARIIARGLSNEGNYYIHRLAFGNGGTEIDAAFTVTFKTPNDGQPPDTQTWESRLYNETYSEIVDDSNGQIGTDPGSAGPNTGTRPGGGANPADDPPTVPNVSGPGVRSTELGLTSDVVVTAVLNPSEPSGQLNNDQTPTDINNDSFTFDEIGLYTKGAPALSSSGSQDVNVNNKTSVDQTLLTPGTEYNFYITVDGAANPSQIFLTPPAGSNPTFGDLCEALNDMASGGPISTLWNAHSTLSGMVGAKVSITDTTFGTYPSITGAQTYGFLRFQSESTKTATTESSIQLAPGDSTGAATDLIGALPGSLDSLPVPGVDKGVANDPVNPDLERERLLTHLIFSPVLKSANRTLTITYTLTISVARTQVTT